MKLKRITLLLFIFFITSIGIAMLTSIAPTVNANNSTYQETVKITMSFAGDCTLGSDFKYGMSGSFVELYNNIKDPSYFFSAVAPIFEEDDLTIVNLEGPLTNSGQKADKQFAFKGSPEYTSILTNGSVEIVNLANNHSRDYGLQGYNETVANLDKAQIGSFGYDRKYITEVNGIKAGFLGYTGWTYNSSVEKQIKSDIKTLKDQGVNVVVVSMHSGIETNNYPNSIQKNIAKCAIDNGADLVVGHHPHVVQGIEEYKGKYIVYSLANFSFGGNKNPSDKDTFIYRQTFEFDKKTMEIVDSVATIYPCSISSVKTRNDFKPTPLTGDEATRVINRIVKYSSSLNNNKDIITKMFHMNQPAKVEEIDASGFKPAPQYKLILLGKEISFESPLFVRDNTIFIPAREFFEKNGAMVELDSENLTLTVESGNNKFIFKIEGDTYEEWTYIPELNGQYDLSLSEIASVPPSFSPVIYRNEIYIPIRSAAQAFGYSVVWDSLTECIYIGYTSGN